MIPGIGETGGNGMRQWLKTAAGLILSAALLLAAGCAKGEPPVDPLPDSADASYPSESVDENGDGETTVLPGGTTSSAASAASRATRSTTRAAAVSGDDKDFVFEDDWIVTGTTAAPEVEESFPVPAGDQKIYGVGYDHTKDTFYQKKRVRVTWLNVWNGSTEFWWADLAKTTSVNGIRVNINGT